MVAEARAEVKIPHWGRGHGRKVGKGKWVKGSFKAIANTEVSPLHRGFGLFGVSGMSLPAPTSYPLALLAVSVSTQLQSPVLWGAAGQPASVVWLANRGGGEVLKHHYGYTPPSQQCRSSPGTAGCSSPNHL